MVPAPVGWIVPHRGNAYVAGDGEVEPGVLPGGAYATVTHVGHPDRLVGVTAGLLAWAEERGPAFDVRDGRWAARLELYKIDPAVEPDMGEREIELAFLLAPERP